MKCCEKSFGPKNEKEDRGQKKLEKKIEKKENKRSMSNSDNTKYWSCNDMMIILLQYDDHHLQFANCCFNHFLTKLADCSTRTFVCNFCKSLRIISLYVLQPFFWIILYQIFKLLFQIIFWIFFNCHFTSFLFSFLQKLQIVVPNQFLCQICNPGQAIPKLLQSPKNVHVCILFITKINLSNRLQVQR